MSKDYSDGGAVADTAAVAAAVGTQEERLRPLHTDDVAISYARLDSGAYVLGLAASLQAGDDGLWCSVDQVGTEADPEVPLHVLEQIAVCPLIVVVGSHGAASSPSVAREVEHFAMRNGTQRIVLITFGEQIQHATW